MIRKIWRKVRRTVNYAFRRSSFYRYANASFKRRR